MAALLEGVAVVVRRDAIDGKIPNGWPHFVSSIKGGSFCFDSELAIVCFMAPPDAGTFAAHLVALGLTHVKDGVAVDLAVADMLQGSCDEAPWLNCTRLDLPEIGGEVAVCTLVGTRERQFCAPAGWSYEHSLTKTGRRHSADEAVSGKLRFLRRDSNGIEAYWDEVNQREVYVASTYHTPTKDNDNLLSRQQDNSRHNELFKAAGEIFEKDRIGQLTPPVALNWFARRRARKAIDLLRQVVEMNASNWSALWMTGKAHQALGEFDASMEAFSKAWLLNGAHPDIAREASISAIEAGRLDAAIYFAEAAVKASPGDHGLRANLALAYLFFGNLAAAESEASAAHRADPGDQVSLAVAVLVGEVKAGRMECPRRSRNIDQAALRRALAGSVDRRE